MLCVQWLIKHILHRYLFTTRWRDNLWQSALLKGTHTMVPVGTWTHNSWKYPLDLRFMHQTTGPLDCIISHSHCSLHCFRGWTYMKHWPTLLYYLLCALLKIWDMRTVSVLPTHTSMWVYMHHLWFLHHYVEEYSMDDLEILCVHEARKHILGGCSLALILGSIYLVGEN